MAKLVVKVYPPCSYCCRNTLIYNLLTNANSDLTSSFPLIFSHSNRCYTNGDDSSYTVETRGETVIQIVC